MSYHNLPFWHVMTAVMEHGQQARRSKWQTYTPWMRLVRVSEASFMLAAPVVVPFRPKATLACPESLSMLPFFARQISARGEFEPYTPTAEDMMANDWEIVSK